MGAAVGRPMAAARTEAEGMAGLPLLQRVPPPLVITPVPLVLTARGRAYSVWRDAVGMRLVRLGLGLGVRG